MYRIPLKYLCDLGKINLPTKIDLKIHCTLQTNMERLFESKKQVTTIGTPDVQIVFLRVLYFQYEQIPLTKNFRQYLETSILSSRFLRMGIQKISYQKTYKLQRGSQEFTIDFKGSYRQFNWLNMSLLYDKSDEHLTIYDSYNTECLPKMVKKI